MFARVTKYRMRPESIEPAIDLLQQLKPQIMEMPGLKHFINVIDDDGNGYVVSISESEAISDANQPQVLALWSKFSDYLAEPPSPSGFRVLMYESSD